SSTCPVRFMYTHAADGDLPRRTPSSRRASGIRQPTTSDRISARGGRGVGTGAPPPPPLLPPLPSVSIPCHGGTMTERLLRVPRSRISRSSVLFAVLPSISRPSGFASTAMKYLPLGRSVTSND